MLLLLPFVLCKGELKSSHEANKIVLKCSERNGRKCARHLHGQVIEGDWDSICIVMEDKRPSRSDLLAYFQPRQKRSKQISSSEGQL